MLKIQIETERFETKAGISAKTGKPYSIREQEACAFTYDRDGKPHPHPQRIRLTLDDDQLPYKIGTYQLCPSSLYVDRFGQIGIRARLRPMAAAAQQVVPMAAVAAPERRHQHEFRLRVLAK